MDGSQNTYSSINQPKVCIYIHNVRTIINSPGGEDGGGERLQEVTILQSSSQGLEYEIYTELYRIFSVWSVMAPCMDVNYRR